MSGCEQELFLDGGVILSKTAFLAKAILIERWVKRINILSNWENKSFSPEEALDWFVAFLGIRPTPILVPFFLSFAWVPRFHDMEQHRKKKPGKKAP